MPSGRKGRKNPGLHDVFLSLKSDSTDIGTGFHGTGRDAGDSKGEELKRIRTK
jgi:hypothetical protein